MLLERAMKLSRRHFLESGALASVMLSAISQAKRLLGLQAGYRPSVLAPSRRPRISIPLDGQWLFQPVQALEGLNPADPRLNDLRWHMMSVPAFWRPIDWWLYSPTKGASRQFFEDEQKRVQKYTFDVWNTRAGWYRHWIEVPAEFRGKRFVVCFSGVASVADVWWNGQHIRSHIGMFGPFECDVTTHVRYGEKNLLAVWVATEQFHVSAAEHSIAVAASVAVTREMIRGLPHGNYDNSWSANRNGGIWSPVVLVITEPVKIADFFFRPRLDGASIDVTVDNAGPEPAQRTISVQLRDHTTGELFHNQVATSPIRAGGGGQTLTRVELADLRPKLWSPDFPNLYRLRVSLEENGRARDEVEHLVGFRTFEVRGTRLYLNGHRYFLRGADTPPYGCRPHDPKLSMKFMNLMHAGNEVMTRFHTSGITETWANAADIAGVGACVEGVWPWVLIGPSPLPAPEAIRIWQEDQLALFRSMRNHPSILMWDINNEMNFYRVPGGTRYLDPDRPRRLEKWKIISDTIQMTRRMDPTRPVIASSNYSRSREEYENDLKPNHIDDGDIDDVHVYNGWYAPSELFVDIQQDVEEIYSQYPRPLISQEASTGYPDNDGGYPVSSYIYPQYVAQSWLGDYVFAPDNPFRRLHARTTQETIEKVRRHRRRIAGWLLFSNCCWFQHVCDEKRIQPYLTYDAARSALQPILISLDNPNRHFVRGERHACDVYIVNDDASFRNLEGLNLHWSIQTQQGRELQDGREPMPDAPYYEQVKREVVFSMPGDIPASRSDLVLKLELQRGRELVSQNTYPIVVVEPGWFRLKSGLALGLLGNDPELAAYLESLGAQVHRIPSLQAARQDLTIVSGKAEIGGKSRLQDFLSSGKNVLFLNPTAEQAELLPLSLWKISDRFRRSHTFGGGECAFIPPGHPLADGLVCPDDLRWWNPGPAGPSVCEWAFSLPRPEHKNLVSLCDYNAPHGYLKAPQDFENYRAALIFESAVGKGRLIASTLRLADDPIARRIIANLISKYAS
jgi:beta-galactosidase